MFKLASLVLCALLAGGVSAQSSTSSAPSGLPSSVTPCILQCVEQALPAGNCSSFTDVSCVCSSTAFQQAAASCLQANCTTSDVATAQALESQECAAASASSSGASATSAASSASSALSSVSSLFSSASASATHSASSSDAAHLNVQGMMGVAVAFIGAALSAGMLL